MKTFTRNLTAFAFAALFAAGCVNEDPAYKNEPVTPPSTEDETGYLTLDGMSLRVIYDSQTETEGDDTAGETKRPAMQADGAQPATDDFLVGIYDASGAPVIEKSYGALKQMFSEAENNRIALPVGTYTMKIRSEAESASPAVAWEHPVYGTTYDFPILKDAPTSIGEVVCKLQNIKVTVSCSADLAARLTDDTESTVSLGAASIVFKKGETRAAYFLPQTEHNTLDFFLKGKFADTMEPTEFSKTIPDVKAGQWRKIALIISHADKGDIKLDIDVENFVQDEEIVVDGTQGAWESGIVDPSSPTIVWEDHNIAEPFQLKASMFDTEGRCTEPFRFDLTSPNGIESLVVTVSSDNAEFITALLGLLQTTQPTFDLCTVAQGTPLYTALDGFGFPLGDRLAGLKSTSFDIAAIMPMLYLNPGFEGNHAFAFALTDSNGRTGGATLRIVVDKANEGAAAPTVVWKGYDIDKQQVVTADMTIDIDVTAPAGIGSFVVTIDSKTLTPLLPTIGLAAQFDLCNIEDQEMAKLLSDPIEDGGLGFPINDEVKNKTYIPFSITYFAQLLVAIHGEHNFVLAITDNKGQTTTKTVRLLSQPQ